MQNQQNNIKCSVLKTGSDGSKATYNTPVLTVLGEASKLTKGNGSPRQCDAHGLGHGEDPCSP